MSPEQQNTINQLRDEGYCVIIWTPEELGDTCSVRLEDIVIERGNEFIEWSNC